MFLSSFFCGAYAIERKIGNMNEQVFQRMKHATKMFFIMGPLWIFEIIEWQLKLTGNYDLNVSKGLLIFHICNSLQVISDFFARYVSYVLNLLFDFRDSLCFAQYAETKLQTFLVQYLVI